MGCIVGKSLTKKAEQLEAEVSELKLLPYSPETSAKILAKQDLIIYLYTEAIGEMV